RPGHRDHPRHPAGRDRRRPADRRPAGAAAAPAVGPGESAKFETRSTRPTPGTLAVHSNGSPVAPSPVFRCPDLRDLSQASAGRVPLGTMEGWPRSRPCWLEPMSAPASAASPAWHLYVPKLVTVLRGGYRLGDLRHDLLAGLTVAIVALPLSMALAIA